MEIEQRVNSRAAWRAIVAPYERRNSWKSVRQLAGTWTALASVFFLMTLALPVSYALVLPLIVPAALLLVRTFVLMHDCSHGSFFSKRWANDVVGWTCGMMTLTPFGQWRHDHARHHASSGDLDRRGHGDVKTLTVREYGALSRAAKWRYRVMRHPAILLGFGPLHLICTQRLRPPGTTLRDPATRSVWSTNAGIAIVVTLVCVLLDWRLFVLLYAPAIYLAAAIGIWLFYVQHQFEDTYWARHGEWDYLTASIQGSSYLRLPRVLAWCTGDIGVHHVHHLSPRIPNYLLRGCHEENPLFSSVTTIVIGDTWRLFRLSLWDEERGCLVGFDGK
jgi:omega-6 fatty acid desaturase (delta-12 desaturase)